MVNADWKLSGAFMDRVREMPASEFPAAMEQQKQEILDYFTSVSEETLLTQEAPMPGGFMLPLGAAILNGPAKWLAAYKMQLFLYAKASGATELKTSNLWRGTDPKPAA
jgi:predicted NAD/FAD-binding protein